MNANVSIADGKPSEYLSASDFKPGKQHAVIYDIDVKLLYLKGFIKPFFMDNETFLSLARDFGENNTGWWIGREVILSVSKSEVAIAGVKRYAAPAQKPSNDIASQLADVLAKAITTQADRVNMSKTLREAADLLLARH